MHVQRQELLSLQLLLLLLHFIIIVVLSLLQLFFFLLVNKQLCIMNILKYKIILSVSAELPAPPY